MWTAALVLVGCTADFGLGARSREVDTGAAPERVEGNHRLNRDDVRWWDGEALSVEAAPPPDDLGDKLAAAFFAEGTLYEFHLSLPSGAGGALANGEWVEATFGSDQGERPAHVRLKGTTSFRDLSGKAAFRIDFDDVPEQSSFHGLRRLTLDNFMQDSSMLHSHVAYWLYRHRGVPAPRHTFAKLWVDGSYYGLYGVSETADEQFLHRAFPGDHHGNLYEGNVADFVEGETKRLELEESDGLYPPYEDIDAVIAAIDAASVEDYTRVLGTIFDLDLLMRMWAIELVTTNVDGYAWYANNYLAYHGEDRWYILPWGHDQCLEWYRDVTDYSKLGGHLVLRCEAAPDCRARLEAEMLDLVDDWEASDIVAITDAVTALVAPHCATDPRAELPCDIEHVGRFVRERPATIREVLE